MRRGPALGLMAGAAVFAVAPGRVLGDDVETEIGCAFAGGRIFATARVASDGGARFWLDTNGSGFVFEDAVAAWKLPLRIDGERRWTRLPAFDPRDALPEPLGTRGELLVFTRSPEDRADPILQGFDGQLGASWFQGRVWVIDSGARRVRMRSEPPGHLVAETAVPLEFATGTDGRRIDGAEYPTVRVEVDGEPLRMAFDTAASVALTERAVAILGGTGPRVRATSFITTKQMTAWRARHPEWERVDDASVHPDVALVRVPRLRLGRTWLGPVWFSTRHGDDVFEGENVTGKLGANAYDGLKVTLDYPAGRLWLEGTDAD